MTRPIISSFHSNRRFGIRLQLLPALLVPLILLWFGYHYLNETDRFLKSAQEQTLRITAQVITAALDEHSDVLLFMSKSSALPANRRRQLESILAPLLPDNMKLWVIDRDLHVLARLGSLSSHSTDQALRPSFAWSNPWPWLHTRLIRPIYAYMIERPVTPMLVPEREVEGALAGMPMFGLRPVTGQTTTVSVATAPIQADEHVVGAVIVEEITNGILIARNHSFERLLSWLLVAMLLVTAALIVYPLWLSARICRLRNEIEHVVDARGRIRTIVASAEANDEIGDLSRSFSGVLGRLEEAAVYRERIASRLSHELRTPIAVVRSSLENLHEPLSDDERRTYLGRADDGLARLSHLLARMTEASRLDQSIADAERAKIDLCELLKSSIEGYTAAYRDRRFLLRIPDQPCYRFVAPDLIVQMLDKLVANAHEFATSGTAIDIHLQPAGKGVILRVANEDVSPPEGNTALLFEPMMSVRQSKHNNTPHLGLGLYIVRLIAEFHGGTAHLSLRDDALGTVMTVTLNHAPYPADSETDAKSQSTFATLGAERMRRVLDSIKQNLRRLAGKLKDWFRKPE